MDRDTTIRMFTHMINIMERHDTMTISCGDPLMELLKDVRELLKEQDPVEPELEGGGSTWWHVCGECHGAIDVSDNFCKHCGRRIRHEKKAE